MNEMSISEALKAVEQYIRVTYKIDEKEDIISKINFIWSSENDDKATILCRSDVGSTAYYELNTNKITKSTDLLTFNKI